MSLLLSPLVVVAVSGDVRGAWGGDMRIPNRHLSIAGVAGRFAIGAPVPSGRQRLHKLVPRPPQEHGPKISQEMLIHVDQTPGRQSEHPKLSSRLLMHSSPLGQMVLFFNVPLHFPMAVRWYVTVCNNSGVVV